MYNFKLLGLVLSTLISVTPVDYSRWWGEPIEFPLTRQDSIAWETQYDVDDLGPDATGSSNHDYMFNYIFHIHCSSACTIANPSTGHAYNISDSEIIYTANTTGMNLHPDFVAAKLNNTQVTEKITASHTYQTADSVYSWTINLVHVWGSWDVVVNFPAMAEGQLVSAGLNELHDFKTDYELIHEKELIYKLVLDKDVEYDTKMAVLNYVRNGQYSEGASYVENYYNQYGLDISDDVTNISNDIDTTKNDFTNKKNQLITLENNQFTTMNENLEDLDFNFDSSQLQQSASFYKRIFTDYVGSTPLFKPISVILFIVLLMILLGAF